MSAAYPVHTLKYTSAVFHICICREEFYFVDRFHSSALQCGRHAACREAHTNVAAESACLMANNYQNEVVIIHRPQEVLKVLSLYTYILFAINCFARKQRYNNSSCTYSTPDKNFAGWSGTSWARCGNYTVASCCTPLSIKCYWFHCLTRNVSFYKIY
jgi:hypothetical protein